MVSSSRPTSVRRVLRRAVSGHIATVADALHRSDLLPPQPLVLIVALRHRDYLRVPPAQPVADLDVSKMQLLDRSIGQQHRAHCWTPPIGEDAGSSTAWACDAIAAAGTQS
jgi:hypothetical protein